MSRSKILLLWPNNVSINIISSRFQTFILLSDDAVYKVWEFLPNLIELTVSLWPLKDFIILKSVKFHNLMYLSFPPLTKNLSSSLIAIAKILFTCYFSISPPLLPLMICSFSKVAVSHIIIEQSLPAVAHFFPSELTAMQVGVKIWPFPKTLLNDSSKLSAALI